MMALAIFFGLTFIGIGIHDGLVEIAEAIQGEK
jgi:hypothetical protein